ncbi:MAG TPA: superoxide dismutase family protein, partial [Ramlibacter sp.]
MHPSTLPLAAVAAALLLAACGAPPMAGMPATQATPATPVAGASAASRSPAIARLVTPQGQPGGQAQLVDTPAGVQVTIEVQGLAPGKHGFHIHAHGACEPGPDGATGRIVPFGAAGPHFDPGATHNHGAPGRPHTEVHAGELPNIEVGADGRGRLQYVNANVTLAPGKQAALGRTLVVHADADDYASDPSGNSGGRVLCGLIEPAQPTPVT